MDKGKDKKELAKPKERERRLEDAKLGNNMEYWKPYCLKHIFLILFQLFDILIGSLYEVLPVWVFDKPIEYTEKFYYAG